MFDNLYFTSDILNRNYKKGVSLREREKRGNEILLTVKKKHRNKLNSCSFRINRLSFDVVCILQSFGFYYCSLVSLLGLLHSSVLQSQCLQLQHRSKTRGRHTTNKTIFKKVQQLSHLVKKSTSGSSVLCSI